MNRNTVLRKMILTAMLAAIAYLIMVVVKIPVVLFLKYEPKDVIITIGGFLLGPFVSMVISLVVSMIEMFTVSETGPIGCLMNFISTCSFACTAAVIYKRKRTLNGAVIGLLAGSVTMICVMLLWNWLITPLYMGGTRESVAAMLVPVFLPFNALKAGLNSALVLVLYKPLTTALRKTALLPQPPQTKGKVMTGVYLLGFALLITCVLFLLAMQGVI